MAPHAEIKYFVPYLRYVAAGAFLLGGLIIQLFIVSVNVTDRLKGRPMSDTDQIITSLGVLRFILHSLSFWAVLQGAFQIPLHAVWNRIVRCIGFMSFFSDIWLSVLLSIIFCLKISNVRNAIFLYLKTIMTQRVGYVIVACVFSAAFLSFLELRVSPSVYKNGTDTEISFQIDKCLNTVLQFFGHILPLLIYVPSSALLVTSLCHHMYTMRHGGRATGSMATYVKTVVFISASCLLFAAHVVSNIAAWNDLLKVDSFGMHCFVNVFPVVHTLYVIYVTTKLRDRLCEIFHCGTKCLSKSNASEPDPRGPVEMDNR
ncbi:taste receptor type 2 member 4-like [Gastrophryne carolinensis]